LVLPQETHGLIMKSQFDELFANLLETLPKLLAALVVDLEGLCIAIQSRDEVDETIIGAVMGAIDNTIKRIKTSTEVSLGSGIFDTDRFQILFVKIDGKTPVLFVMVADLYTNIDKFIPYSYLVAEKISLILHNRYTSLSVPKLDFTGDSEGSMSQMLGKKTIVKLLILGDTKVGKTSLIELYINGEIEPTYKPTIGISILTKELQISKSVGLIFQIFDMSGLKSLAKVRRSYYNHVFSSQSKLDTVYSVILVMFDSTKIETLENTKYWFDESRKFINDQKIPYILLANKIDLVSNREKVRSKAESIAADYNCTYIETSAVTGEGLDEIFTQLAGRFS
jgi:small GTP-binding protein